MRRRKGLSPEIKVGLFVLIGLILLGYMSIKITKYGKRVKRGYEVSAIFDSVSGLVKDASVEISGVEVGRVGDISLKHSQAKVDMVVAPEVQLKKDARAIIRTRGVLGDKFVELVPGTLAQEIGPGEAITDTTSQTEFDRVLTDMGPILTDLQSVTHTLSEVIGTEEGKENFRELVDNFREASVSVRAIARDIEEGKGTLGKLVKDDDLYDNLKKASTKLVEDNGLFDQTTEAMSTLRKIVKDVEAGKGSLGKLVSDETIYTDAQDTFKNLKNITQRIEEGEGTLGKLSKDEKLYEDARAALEGMRKAAEGVQEQTPITTLGVIGAAATQ
jgi:phospholipid/cholesterol/gamma-HCH transport system substrate-binding protein